MEPRLRGAPEQLARTRDGPYYTRAMVVRMGATTTVRLSDEERGMLAQLVPDFGDQSGVIKHGIRMLADEQQRRRALRELLSEWELDSGPVDEGSVAAMTELYFAE